MVTATAVPGSPCSARSPCCRGPAQRTWPRRCSSPDSLSRRGVGRGPAAGPPRPGAGGRAGSPAHGSCRRRWAAGLDSSPSQRSEPTDSLASGHRGGRTATVTRSQPGIAATVWLGGIAVAVSSYALTGDAPHYLTIARSLVADGDLDLRERLRPPRLRRLLSRQPRAAPHQHEPVGRAVPVSRHRGGGAGRAGVRHVRRCRRHRGDGAGHGRGLGAGVACSLASPARRVAAWFGSGCPGAGGAVRPECGRDLSRRAGGGGGGRRAVAARTPDRGRRCRCGHWLPAGWASPPCRGSTCGWRCPPRGSAWRFFGRSGAASPNAGPASRGSWRCRSSAWPRGSGRRR